GVFRSDDGGHHWSAARRGLPALAVLALVVPPDDPELVYAAVADPSNQGSIVFSTDGGASWRDATPKGPNVYSSAFATDPHDRSLLYVTTGWGIFRTRFGRASWTRVWVPPFWAPESLAVDPARGSALYASLIDEGSGGGVYMSLDGGGSWTVVNGQGQELQGCGCENLVFDPATPGTLYVIDFAFDPHRFEEVFKTADGGRTWTDTGVSGISLAISAAGTLYLDQRLPSGATRLLKSLDHGATWKAAPGAPDVVNSVSLAAAAGAAPGPASETVLALGEQGLWRSTDGGASWSATSDGMVAQSVGALDVGGDGTLYFGVLFDQGRGGAGIFRGRAHGERLRRLTASGGEQIVIDPLNPRTIYAGRTGLIQQKSVDGGVTWSGVSFPDGSLVVDPTSSATLYTTRQPYAHDDFACLVSKSVDSGATWSCIQRDFLQGFDALVVDPRQASILYGFDRDASMGLVWRSDDAGASWSEASAGLPAGSTGLALAVDSQRPPRLYALTDQGLFRSSDRARGWHFAGNALPAGAASLIADGRTTPSTLYAGIPGAGVFGSTDGGATWAVLGRGLPAQLFTGTFALDAHDPASPATLYAATAGLGVFRLAVPSRGN
ncbi:MAG TPA: hypothetical protein VN999_19475, partial [Thermoanaerobaculia bacterium]|nr:hypothetical protein [Thermoanaerobaculia bacterium]